MADVLAPEQRRRNMSRIRGRDTKPEMLVRRGLHAKGLRFRVQRRDLPGRPDLTFPKYRCVVQVHGCFWHWHGCPLCKVPKTRTEFWEQKIATNVERDRAAEDALRDIGWRIALVWECSLRGKARLPENAVVDQLMHFIRSERVHLVITGNWHLIDGKGKECSGAL